MIWSLKVNQKHLDLIKTFTKVTGYKNKYIICSISIYKQKAVWDRNQENNTFKKIKICQNKFNKGGDWPVEWKPQVHKQRKQKRHQKVGGYPMLMDQQNQCCENIFTIWINLYDQHNPYQNSNNILHGDRKFNLKVHVDAQKTSSSKNNPETKKQYWGYHNTWLQATLQCYGNKNSMLLTQNTDMNTNGIE
jgi:hypothetical protein